jgi:riboflavin synthase
MFTGIIEEVGTVASIERGDGSARFTVSANTVSRDAQLGDSITINGACLTVVDLKPGELSFDVVYETMQRTAFGALAIGDQVNLERSLLANGRFGGHIVQGHVDGTGTIASIREVDNSYYIYVTALSGILRYVVRKGSIAIDGISLTVVEADDKTFSVSIIPYTWEHTNLHTRRAGDLVNLETDIIGKYVEKLIGGEYGRNDTPTRIADLVREEKPLTSVSTYLE